MAKAVITYDKDLPEIPGRCPWLPPTSYLVKDKESATGWRENTSGRRPSMLLLIEKLRTDLDQWRDNGYPGVSDTTRRLLEYWFQEDRDVPNFPAPFRYHFCQREAIESLIYVVEIKGLRDAKELVDAVQRWKEHFTTYKKLGTRPVLFIMVEKNVHADAIGEYLVQTKEFGLKESEVLVIHTDSAGEITKADLDKAREAARDIDGEDSKTKAIVSVMMLREGWDVKNVSVVLGLRPFTAKAEILPEQVIGRGLRLMLGIGADRTQTLEVLGTRNLLKVLREQLEADGVGVATARHDPPKPIIIEPVMDRIAYDIAIPLTKPRLTHNTRKLTSLNANAFEPIYNQDDLNEVSRLTLKMEFATTETEVHQTDLAVGLVPIAQELLSSITTIVMQKARLTDVFAQLYPVVRSYVRTRCFGKLVDVEDETIRTHLHRLELREGIAKYLARKISELTVEKGTLEFENAGFTLSQTKPFSWRRNLPPLEAKHTVFNYVATYNDFERTFAKFADEAGDVLRFASLGTTEQGDSNTQFRVDYLKPSGAIGFYHPDWVPVLDLDDEQSRRADHHDVAA